MRETKRKESQGYPQRLHCHIERSRNVFLNSNKEASTPLSLTKALLFGRRLYCKKGLIPKKSYCVDINLALTLNSSPTGEGKWKSELRKLYFTAKNSVYLLLPEGEGAQRAEGKHRKKMYRYFKEIPEQNNMLLVSSKICLFALFLVFAACQPKHKERTAKQFEPVLWEIMSTDTTLQFTDSLQNWVAAQENLQDAVVKRWKNYYVVYAQSDDSLQVTTSLATSFKNQIVQFYHQPYYHFERSHCADTAMAKEFEYYILTANLVADTTLQKEYMQYHKTQYQEWPEIAKGFCNASFQHLIMFRNDRQLMLIITIPKGKTLDELNPLTEKDNPRVKEWNAIMAKYQEGIPGTQKNEIWVFFE